MKKHIVVIVWVLFCVMLITNRGHCGLSVVKSSLNDGYTIAVPIYSDDDMAVYAAKDAIDTTICWTSYPKDGRFYMRLYYECQNDKCREALISAYDEGVKSGQIHRWTNVEAKWMSYLAIDVIFDWPNRNRSTKTEVFVDKWGYMMGTQEYTPIINESISENRPLSYEVAYKLNEILTIKLQEARDNPHSCLNVGTGYSNSSPRR